jgi:uncharacterized protein (DUF2235 family)
VIAMPKNIVLLSDGTGNSAAKLFKTNIWRLYQALDIEPEPPGGSRRQVVLYDEGVGSDNFKPLALLGSAFGIGVWKNVRDLYTFTCRNYEKGDRILAFGFSRGAFTVRLLVGMIGKCGLVVPDSEDDLKKKVAIAYLEYRRDFLLRASRQRYMLYHHVLANPHYVAGGSGGGRIIDIPGKQERPNIAFLGVWDTVSAYGLPVDELERGIDQWIWPITVADRELSPMVLRARQALSLDDERPTFRPVLWNEQHGQDRISQVWFTGVHANVGGGYPDDGLAHVTLEWMMNEVGPELRFYPQEREEIRHRANAFGQYYDSRSGIAGYYRYGPRSVERLCHDRDHDVEIATAKFHPSALERIRRRQVAYAPLSPPLAFEVIEAPGHERRGVEQAYDAMWMEQARNAVWWRRLSYLATVALSALLVAFPLLDKWVLPATFDPLMPIVDLLRRIPVDVAGILPGWSRPWITSFLHRPTTALVLALLLVWLFWRKSGQLQDKIAARAELAWAQLKQITAVPQIVRGWDDRLAEYFRNSPVWTSVHRFVSRQLIPFLFAWTIGLVVLVFVVIKLGLDAIKLRRLLKDRTSV